MKQVFIIIFLILFGCNGGNDAAVNPISATTETVNPTSTPAETVFSSVRLFDNFSTPLNLTLWDTADPNWPGDPQWKSQFIERNVYTWGGNLHLSVTYEPWILPTGIDYGIGMIRSKQTFLYGEFTARIKTVNHAVNNGFWLYNNTDPNWWTEIGILEVNPAYFTDYHYGVWEHHPNPYEKHFFHDLGGWPEWGDWYHYKLVWTPDYLEWSIEGIPINRISNTRWHQPLHVCLSVQVWDIPPPSTHLPLVMMVDWVGVKQ